MTAAKTMNNFRMAPQRRYSTFPFPRSRFTCNTTSAPYSSSGTLLSARLEWLFNGACVRATRCQVKISQFSENESMHLAFVIKASHNNDICICISLALLTV